MAKNIKWSKQAVADRIQILDYWFKRIGDKTYSKKLDKSLREAILLLSEQPLMGKESEEHGVRCFVKGNYRIYYRIKMNHVELLHIWDSKELLRDRPVVSPLNLERLTFKKMGIYQLLSLTFIPERSTILFLTPNHTGRKHFLKGKIFKQKEERS